MTKLSKGQKIQLIDTYCQQIADGLRLVPTCIFKVKEVKESGQELDNLLKGIIKENSIDEPDLVLLAMMFSGISVLAKLCDNVKVFKDERYYQSIADTIITTKNNIFADYFE